MLKSPLHWRRSPHLRAGAWLAVLAAGLCLPAQAHDFKAGEVVIDHPYALPTPPGSPNGALHLRALRNSGRSADRLLGAKTPVAASVEIHHMQLDAQNVMRMRAVDALALPPGSEVSLKHGSPWHLMLMGLKAPLKDGDRFPVTLRFERGGEKTVQVWVQTPRVATPAEEAQAIAQVMKRQFDRPEAPLTVAPVSVQGEWALAGWSQAAGGGRALLKKAHGQHWEIAVCGGDGLLAAATLRDAGLAPAQAESLVRAQRQAETALAPAQRARFASFQGLTKIQGGAHPPAAHGSGAGAAHGGAGHGSQAH